MFDFRKFTDAKGNLPNLKQWGIEKYKSINAYVTNNRKRSLIIGSIAATVLVGSSLGMFYYQANAVTLYHVYVDGVEVGTVNDQSVIDDWQKQQVEIAQDRYNVDNVQLKSSITLKKDRQFKGTFNNLATLKALNGKLDFEVEGVELVVGGKVVGIVKDQATADRIIEEIKQSYSTGRSEKEKVVAAAVDQSNTPKVMVEELKIKEKVDLEKANISPDKIISKEDMLTLLKRGTLEEKKYEVKEGDTISEIAVKHGLSSDQVFQLNPDIKGELIHIGDELSVTSMTPLLTVQAKEVLSKVERIPYQVEYEKDSSMYTTESKVVQDGEEGQKKVEYEVVKENGVVIEKTILNEEVIEEAKNKVVKKGTKYAPARGSGSYTWPTVGGIITSTYGSRWGRMHEGIDISGVSNRTIKAADNGRVIHAGWKGAFGKSIIIDHGNGVQTLYAHMSSLSVSNGSKVAKGQKIGVMGNTGRSTGTHLHFEVLVNGKNKNPLSYVSR